MRSIKDELQIKFVFALKVLFSFSLIMILACEGPIGPAGPAGSAGTAGADGADGAAGAAGADGADGESVLVGYGSFNAGDGPGGACVWLPDGSSDFPCVYNFGGSSTDSVTVAKNAVGDYHVVFHGKYGPNVGGESLRFYFTVLATITQGDGTYVVAASHASDGSASHGGTDELVRLETRVQIWNTTDLSPADKDFSVVMLHSF